MAMQVLSMVPGTVVKVLADAWDLAIPKEITSAGINQWMARFLDEPYNAVFVGAIVLFLAKFGIAEYSWLMKRLATSAKRKKKQTEHKNALEQMKRMLTGSQEEYENILSLDLPTLLKQLKEDKLKPTRVLEAYQHQALKSHEKTNCLVEPLSEATDWARELEADGKRGPLYGLPVAVKDDMNVKGHDSVIGCSKFIGKPSKVDSVVVQVLKKQGAVPFVKTNVPQTMISIESSNPVFGTTTNPYNSERSAGGSSGGTGALVATGGALIGTGSDLGGSIRIPAAFNGVFGFKPTANRISGKDTHGAIDGVRLVPVSFGPLSSSMEGIVTFMKALLTPYMFELDNRVPPMPFDDGIYDSTRKLRIACFTDIGKLSSAPACCRAVDLAKDALVKAGHEIIYLTPDFRDIGRYVSGTATGDGGDSLLDLIRYDKVDTLAFGLMTPFLKAPVWLRKTLIVVLSVLQPHLADAMIQLMGQSTVKKWWQYTAAMDQDVEKVFSFWKENKLDGLLCPAFPIHSCKLGHWTDMADITAYTMVFNTMDCPAGIVPVTKVTKQDEELAKNYPEGSSPERKMKENMQDAEGLPVCVQLVTLPWQDELCMKMMRDVQNNITS